MSSSRNMRAKFKADKIKINVPGGTPIASSDDNKKDADNSMLNIISQYKPLSPQLKGKDVDLDVSLFLKDNFKDEQDSIYVRSTGRPAYKKRERSSLSPKNIFNITMIKGNTINSEKRPQLSNDISLHSLTE